MAVSDEEQRLLSDDEADEGWDSYVDYESGCLYYVNEQSKLRTYDTPNVIKRNKTSRIGQVLPAEDVSPITQVVKELVKTEKSYVQHLDVLDQLYLAPLKASAETSKPILTEAEIKCVFRNVGAIVELHRNLLQGMGDLNPSSTAYGVGKLFKEFTPYMKMYLEYTRLYQEGNAALSTILKKNKAFANLCKRAREKTPRNLDLQSILIMPVQRLPRYRLILERMIEEFPDGSDEQKELAVRCDEVAETANFIDDEMSNCKDIVATWRVDRTLTPNQSLMNPFHFLIREGPLLKISEKHGYSEKMSCYLLHDEDAGCLKFIYGQADNMVKNRVKVRRAVEVQRVRVVDDSDDKVHAFAITAQQRIVVLKAASAAEKKSWVKDICETANIKPGSLERTESLTVASRILNKHKKKKEQKKSACCIVM